MNEREYQSFITDLFNKIKRKEKEADYISIPIYDKKGNLVGLLKPITFDYNVMYPGCVSLLSKWRRENPSISNSLFEITDERTEKWLLNLILRRDDRLLFFIDNLRNEHIGHIAYSSFDFNHKSMEIDSVLHGELGDIRGIMTYSVNAMIDWALRNLYVDNIYLSTDEDNERSKKLYFRCGFEIIERIPLFRHELMNEIRWDPDPSKDSSIADKYAVKMKYMRKK